MALIETFHRRAVLTGLILVGFAAPGFAPAAAAGTAEIPMRDGPRPETTQGVPHIQLGVAPIAPDLLDEMLRRVEAIPGVSVRPTVISLPGAKGFWLEESLSLAHPEAIVGGREFAHVHPDGSLHASLHPDWAKAAIRAGWAAAHPWAARRPGWDGFVLLYTPRTEAELDVVFRLILGSYSFITGRQVEAEKL